MRDCFAACVDVGAESKAIATFTSLHGNMNMAWSPDGQRIAVGDRSDNISIFDAAAAVQMASEKQPCEVRSLVHSAN